MQGAGRAALLDKDRLRLLPQKKRPGPRHGIKGGLGVQTPRSAAKPAAHFAITAHLGGLRQGRALGCCSFLLLFAFPRPSERSSAGRTGPARLAAYFFLFAFLFLVLGNFQKYLAARSACSPARRAAGSRMNSVIVYEVATGETAVVNPDYILEAQVPYHSTVLYMLGMIFGVLLVALLFKR